MHDSGNKVQMNDLLMMSCKQKSTQKRITRAQNYKKKDETLGKPKERKNPTVQQLGQGHKQDFEQPTMTRQPGQREMQTIYTHLRH